MGKKRQQAPKRVSSRGKRSESFEKDVKPLVIFAVEGKIEREYLKALNQSRYGSGFSFEFCPTFDKASAKNLLVSIKRKLRDLGRDGGAGAWIVCDVDQNNAHAEGLQEWL